MEQNNLLKTVKDKAILVWDWPVVPGAKYDAQERKQLKNLSEYFSTVAALGVGGAAAVCSAPVWATTTAATAGVVAGHYLAGLVTHLRR